MHRKKAHLLGICTLSLTVSVPWTARGESQAPRVCEVAKARKRPSGAPKASDVIIRSLRRHPRNKKDPHDTMQALRDFHVTRLEWAYIKDQDFIAKVKASGRVFGGAASAPSFVPPSKDDGWFERVVVVNARGEPIIAPWKRNWKRTLWGCVNNPELERGYMTYLKRYIDAGAEVMQRDEPGANQLATRWGGCFCKHCMKGFREYLGKHTTAEERAKLGIEDLSTFDYGKKLLAEGAPVGDPFGRWKGGELKKLFVDFQIASTLAFHKRTRKAIDAYAGRHVPFSCNNGVRRWTPIQLLFDWTFGELSFGHARPHFMTQAMRTAAEHDRLQVVTMPKKGNRDDLPGWERRTRQTIAMAYAAGGLCMVPWDVYMPHDAPRYFGTPEQYADLYAFVRGAAEYLDGYEEAATVGKGLKETRYGEVPPVEIEGGTGEVFAVVRARPGDQDAPVVIHLVEWGKQSKPFAVRLRRACFFATDITVRMLAPAAYDKAAHAQAEQTRDFAPLVVGKAIPLTEEAGIMTAGLPPRNPWCLLIVERKP